MLYFDSYTNFEINSTKTVNKLHSMSYNGKCKGGDYKNAYWFWKIFKKNKNWLWWDFKRYGWKLNVSAAYLSAVEMGKRNIPEQWVNRISELYNLSDEEKSNLNDAADNSAKSITLNFDNISNSHKETAIFFAREFENVDTETLDKIKKLLRNAEK